MTSSNLEPFQNNNYQDEKLMKSPYDYARELLKSSSSLYSSFEESVFLRPSVNEFYKTKDDLDLDEDEPRFAGFRLEVFFFLLSLISCYLSKIGLHLPIVKVGRVMYAIHEGVVTAFIKEFYTAITTLPPSIEYIKLAIKLALARPTFRDNIQGRRRLPVLLY